MTAAENGSVRERWRRVSLKKKVQLLTGGAALSIALWCVCGFLGTVWEMSRIQGILRENAAVQEFQESMKSEISAINGYLRHREETEWRACETSFEQTKRSLAALPSTYGRIGEERFARTYSIRSLYSNYEGKRDALLAMNGQETSFGDQLYRISRMQFYLERYGGTLGQLTVEAGNRTYGQARVYFIVLPFISALTGLTAVLLFFGLRRFMNESIVRPVLALAQDADRIGQGDFSGPMLAADSEDEMGRLIRSFQAMKQATLDNIHTLKEKHQVEQQLSLVQLQLLKSQMNPHFLFNTLNVIAGMAEIEDAGTTEKMIQALSRLFRYNLKSTDACITLAQEKKVVEDYLYLQKMRFGARLSISWDVAEETCACMIPSFCLQPLVENAIIHGISPLAKGGRIHIRARRKDGQLILSVADTGCGMPVERLRELREDFEHFAEPARYVGIGVGNICRRVHVMYPDGQAQVYSREGAGTVIRILFTPELIEES